jgi:hypothetical protein
MNEVVLVTMVNSLLLVRNNHIAADCCYKGYNALLYYFLDTLP